MKTLNIELSIDHGAAGVGVGLKIPDFLDVELFKDMLMSKSVMALREKEFNPFKVKNSIEKKTEEKQDIMINLNIDVKEDGAMTVYISDKEGFTLEEALDIQYWLYLMFVQEQIEKESKEKVLH